MNEIDVSKVVILRGRIARLHAERETGDFLFSDTDREAIGLTAVGAALVGSGGAVGLASMADVKEEATKVHFEIDEKVVSGWLMWSPFSEGDEVEVVAEKARDGTFVAFAVLRLSDRTIALYPHCSRERLAHLKSSASLFFKVYGIVCALYFIIWVVISMYDGATSMNVFLYSLVLPCLGGVFLYGFIAFRMSRRFLPFAKMAEAIFAALGWKDVKNIDLPARSRAERKASGTPGLGKLYFRY
ncbi:putative type VI secretion system effector [Xanthomonas oryzae]|uniref:putative type VI secretion system effector n=1 Tax=Xanthomonas oryzae TaxID=347 RepID=UPI001A91EED0|nr:putative type VI secretion system effector [Xanthomonas oryzae]